MKRIRAWLTWATWEEAAEVKPLSLRTRFWRRVFDIVDWLAGIKTPTPPTEDTDSGKGVG